MWEPSIFKIKPTDPNRKLMTNQYGFMTAGCISGIGNGLAHASSNHYVWFAPRWPNRVVKVTPSARLTQHAIAN
jgi:hypothetical protein